MRKRGGSSKFENSQPKEFLEQKSTLGVFETHEVLPFNEQLQATFARNKPLFLGRGGTRKKIHDCLHQCCKVSTATTILNQNP